MNKLKKEPLRELTTKEARSNELLSFLEEEITDFGIDFGHARNCDLQPPNDGEQTCSCGYEQLEYWLQSHDQRLVNKVLEIIQEKVEWHVNGEQTIKELMEDLLNNLTI